MTLNTNKFILLSLCWVLLISFQSKAVLVQKLNEASITVKSKSKKDKNTGISKALKRVLVKNSGSTSILNDEQIKKTLSAPSSLMSQFSFVEIDNKLKLNVTFEEQKILALLRSAKVPVWGRQRPTTLLWIVFEEGSNESIILSDGSAADLSQSIVVAADEYSVPVLFPLMDFTESTSISDTDIKGLFVDRFYGLSARYEAEYFALTSVSKSTSAYNYSINLYKIDDQGFNRAELIKSGVASDTASLSKDLVNSLSEYYAQKFAVITNAESNTVQVTFDEVTDLENLISLENHLMKFTIIKSLYTSSIINRSVTFSIKLYGTKDDLYRTLSLDQNIVKSLEGNTSENDKILSNYIWQRQ